MSTSWLFEAMDYARQHGRLDLVDDLTSRLAEALRQQAQPDRLQVRRFIAEVAGARIDQNGWDHLLQALDSAQRQIERLADLDPHEAREFLHRIDEIRRVVGRGDVAAFGRCARLLRNLGAPATAFEAASRLLDIEPDNPFGIATSVGALVDLGRPEDAIELVRERAPDTEDPYVVRALARAYRRAGDTEEASKLERDLTDTDGAIAQGKSSGMYAVERARELMRDWRLDEAESIIRPVVAAYPDWPEPAHLLEQIQARQRSRDQRASQP